MGIACKDRVMRCDIKADRKAIARFKSFVPSIPEITVGRSSAKGIGIYGSRFAFTHGIVGCKLQQKPFRLSYSNIRTLATTIYIGHRHRIFASRQIPPIGRSNTYIRPHILQFTGSTTCVHRNCAVVRSITRKVGRFNRLDYKFGRFGDYK